MFYFDLLLLLRIRIKITDTNTHSFSLSAIAFSHSLNMFYCHYFNDILVSIICFHTLFPLQFLSHLTRNQILAHKTLESRIYIVYRNTQTDSAFQSVYYTLSSFKSLCVGTSSIITNSFVAD